MNDNLIKVADYARAKGISAKSAYKQIKNGKLLTKKVNGITYIITGIDTASSGYDIEQQENQKWMQLQNDEKKVKLDLQLQKLKNLRQDTILKQLKQQAVKEKYRTEYCEMVLECFVNSFADLKNFLINLRMDKLKIQEFQTIFKKDIKKFESSLKKAIQKKDEEQEELNAEQ